MKKSYYVGTGVVVLVVIVLLAIPSIFNNKENVKGVEETRTPEELVETYVRENISELSPEPEVLGGKFFVTEFEAEDGNGTVEYDDGHNAYVADFSYEVDGEGNVTIKSFVATVAQGENVPPSKADILK